MRRRPLPRKNPVLHPARPEALVRESPTWTHLGKEHPAPRQPASGRCSMRAGPFGRPLRSTESHRNSRTDQSQVNFAAFAAIWQNKTWCSGSKRWDVSEAALRLVKMDRYRARPAAVCVDVDRGRCCVDRVVSTCRRPEPDRISFGISEPGKCAIGDHDRRNKNLSARKCGMRNSERGMGKEKRRMTDGRCRMADDRWQMADGGWHMTNGG